MRGSAFRTAAVIAAVAIVVSLLFSTTLLVSGVERSVSVGADRLGADILVLLPEQVDPTRRYFWFVIVKETVLGEQPPASYFNALVVQAIEAITGVAQASPQLYVGVRDSAEPDGTPIQLVAYDPESDFTIRAWLGGPQPTEVGSDSAVAGAATGLAVGDTLEIGGQRLTIVGMLDTTGTGMDQTVFFPLATAYRLVEEGAPERTSFQFTADAISAVLVKVQPTSDPVNVAVRIRDQFRHLDPITVGEVSRGLGERISSLATYLVMIATATWGAAVVLIGSVFSMTVHERRKHLGLLRALGARKDFIFRLVLSEASIIALLGGLVGLGVGLGVTYGVQQQVLDALAVPFLQPSGTELLPLVGAFLGAGAGTGAAAAAIPALRASRLEPYDSIRWGE
jgi:putative ABC transport system permease protein